MKFSKLVSLLGATSLVLTLIAPTAHATLFPGFPDSSDRQALTIEDLVDNPFSYIVNNDVYRDISTQTSVETPEKSKLCGQFNSHGCNLDGKTNLTINSVLPVCSTAIENCVESLQISNGDGTFSEAKFVRYFKGETFPAVDSLGMPGGSRPSLWEAPGATNQGGTSLYVVNSRVRWNYRNGQGFINNFSASVYPVKEKFNTSYKEPGINYVTNRDGKFQSITESGEILYDGTCVATEAGMCAEKAEFANGAKVKLSMRLSNLVTGWLHGRIAKPDITVTPLNAMFNQLVVSAEVVDVPMMYAQFYQSQMTPEFVKLYLNNWSIGRGLNGTSFWRQFYPENPVSSTLITTLAESVKDTATEVHTYWNLTSLQNTSENKCMSDTSKLIGFVTTNAMAYSGTAPTWDGETLQYKVAGLHFLPDGKTLTSGSYDLAMRSDTARCLYGFTNAPISASISVTSADGEQKVATTVLNEKNGWLYLAAYGFSFSSPTIKIKLTQEKPKEIAPSPTPSATKSSAIKTIKCTKGKTIKTVKGANPKCPAGYKAK
jgi:hypothetical protein